MTADEIIRTLDRAHNAILEGVPGVGKTYVVQEVARHWTSVTGRPLRGPGGQADGLHVLTLHPSTSYEDFVEGLRPLDGTTVAKTPLVGRAGTRVGTSASTSAGWFDAQPGGHAKSSGPPRFGLRDGFFVSVCVEAMAAPDHDFLVVLDEVSRANVPKVLGDLLTTLESSKRMRRLAAVGRRAASPKDVWRRNSALAVRLPYSGRLFAVPQNVFVLGTMNTSDRSVAGLDVALRRRFAFLRLEPMEPAKLMTEIAKRCASTPTALATAYPLLLTAAEAWGRLNTDVLGPLLGPDALLGHSYLLDTGVRSLPLLDADVLHDQSVVAVGWLEYGLGTGGADTQTNFPGKLAPHLGGAAGALTGNLVEFDAMFDGVRHRGTRSVNRRGQGKNPSGAWHTTFGQPDHPQASRLGLGAFGGSIVSFVARANAAWTIRRHPLSDLTALRAMGAEKQTPASQGKTRRWYGTPSLADARRAAGARQDAMRAEVRTELARSWRLAVLPQLAETLTMVGMLDLLAGDARRAPLLRNGGTHALGPEERGRAEEALTALHALHDTLGLTTSVRGAGLGRGLTVTAL
jgi:hypothetical protein